MVFNIFSDSNCKTQILSLTTENDEINQTSRPRKINSATSSESYVKVICLFQTSFLQTISEENKMSSFSKWLAIDDIDADGLVRGNITVF